MSFRITGVDHVGLTVFDLDRSVEFYQRVLDCVLLYQRVNTAAYLGEIVGYPGAEVRTAHLRTPGGAAGVEIELFEYREPPTTLRDLEPRNVGNAHISFVVENIGSLYERMVDQGVDVFSPPVTVDQGPYAGGVSFYARDPDGITIEVFEAASGSTKSAESTLSR